VLVTVAPLLLVLGSKVLLLAPAVLLSVLPLLRLLLSCAVMRKVAEAPEAMLPSVSLTALLLWFSVKAGPLSCDCVSNVKPLGRLSLSVTL
jgi:hypothetical protein